MSEGECKKKLRAKRVPNLTRQGERKAKKLVKHFKKVGGDDLCARKAFDNLPLSVKNKFKIPPVTGKPGKKARREAVRQRRMAVLQAMGCYKNVEATA